jgi:hypothetical protein
MLTSLDPQKHCLWLKRTIDGIEDLDPSYLVSRYIGTCGTYSKVIVETTLGFVIYFIPLYTNIQTKHEHIEALVMEIVLHL